MPVPHEVAQEFFIPTQDSQYFNNETQNTTQHIEERLNDLLFLFNLLDVAFGRNNENNNTNHEGETSEAEEEAGNMFYEEEESRDNENDEDQNNAASRNTENIPPENGEERSANAHQRVIRLDEFDILALPFLLMRQRTMNDDGRNSDRSPQETHEETSDSEENVVFNPFIRIISQAFGQDNHQANHHTHQQTDTQPDFQH